MAPRRWRGLCGRNRPAQRDRIARLWARWARGVLQASANALQAYVQSDVVEVVAGAFLQAVLGVLGEVVDQVELAGECDETRSPFKDEAIGGDECRLQRRE